MWKKADILTVKLIVQSEAVRRLHGQLQKQNSLQILDVKTYF